jgi:hypothetical protein
MVCLVMAVVLATMYTTGNIVMLGVLTAIIGTFAPGMVPLALARVHELNVHHSSRQNIAWARASIIAAAAMAGAAYGYSALFNATGGNHRLLFLTAAATLIVAILAGLIVPTDPGESQAMNQTT